MTIEQTIIKAKVAGGDDAGPVGRSRYQGLFVKSPARGAA